MLRKIQIIHRIRYTTTFIFILLFSGCASVTVTRFDNLYREPSQHIQVYSSQASITVSYREIALMTFKADSEETAIRSFRLKAAELGADAIILQPTESRETVMAPMGNLWYSESRASYRALAIEYK